MKDRKELTDKGKIEEIVASGGAHLERMGQREWFLNLFNADGSSTAIWFEGKISSFEERSPPLIPLRRHSLHHVPRSVSG